MNPSEIFYTMYEMIEHGYDLPVEKLSSFKGFDLGSKSLTVYTNPQGLISLFDIGICAFIGKVDYEIDYEGSRIIFKSFPYALRGIVFDNQVSAILEKNNYTFNTFKVDPNGVSIHDEEGFALELKVSGFYSRDLNAIKADIESNFFKQLYSNYYNFAHEIDIEIENKIETGMTLKSRSVRETLIRCIENFKDITALRYQMEIDELEDKIKVLRIYEKATREYMAVEIQRLLREPDYVRTRDLKVYADKYHESNPDVYPEFTMDEIVNYIWVRDDSNRVLANLNQLGHENYRSRIEYELKNIEMLKGKLNPKGIIEEAKATYLYLSQVAEYKRKSPVKFINGGLSLDAKEKMIDYTSIFEKGKIDSKIHFYSGNTIVKTSGKTYLHSIHQHTH